MQGYPLKAGEPRGISLKDTLLPEYLRKLGYSTHLVGKWHVGYCSDYYTPTNRGFDTFLGYYNGYITYFSHTIEQDVSLAKQRNIKVLIAPENCEERNIDFEGKI